MTSSRLGIGVLLPTREVVIHGFPTSKVITMAELVERSGYDSVWVGDSVLTKPRLESITILASIAMRTETVKLGTAVFLAALRNPVLVAHSVATLDQIAYGRTILGVGIGGGRYTKELFEKEFNSCGVPFDERVKRMEEVIQITKMLWEKDQIDYAGKYYNLNGVSMPLKPYNRSRVPIWISGSIAESALRRVARLGDGWICNIVNPEEFRESWIKVQKFAKDFGRDTSEIHPCNYLYLNLDTNREESHREADAFLTKYYNAKFTQEILERWGSFGDTKDCVKRLEAVIEAGAKSVILHFASLDPVTKLEIFTRDVLPSFN